MPAKIAEIDPGEKRNRSRRMRRNLAHSMSENLWIFLQTAMGGEREDNTRERGGTLKKGESACLREREREREERRRGRRMSSGGNLKMRSESHGCGKTLGGQDSGKKSFGAPSFEYR